MIPWQGKRLKWLWCFWWPTWRRSRGSEWRWKCECGWVERGASRCSPVGTWRASARSTDGRRTRDTRVRKKKPQIPHIIILIINKLTTRQPGILWRWSGRLEQSTIGHSFGTYIINFQKHAQDTSFLAFLLHWLTVSQSTSSEHCTAPL